MLYCTTDISLGPWVMGSNEIERIFYHLKLLQSCFFSLFCFSVYCVSVVLSDAWIWMSGYIVVLCFSTLILVEIQGGLPKKGYLQAYTLSIMSTAAQQTMCVSICTEFLWPQYCCECFERTQRPVHNYVLRGTIWGEMMAEKHTLQRVDRRITKNVWKSLAKQTNIKKTSRADGMFQSLKI